MEIRWQRACSQLSKKRVAKGALGGGLNLALRYRRSGNFHGKNKSCFKFSC